MKLVVVVASDLVCKQEVYDNIKKCDLLISAAFGGQTPLGRSPMRSSRRSLSYASIKLVIESVSKSMYY